MDNDDSYDHVVPGSDEELSTPDVRGYDFRGEFDFGELLESYATTGFQATQLAEAIDIAERMQEQTPRSISRVPRTSSRPGSARPSRISCGKGT